jgi:hypothetical protein
VTDRLPDDPFRGHPHGARFDDLAEAAGVWELLRSMTVEEMGRAVRGLDRRTLEDLVLEVLLFSGSFGSTRLAPDGSISWERPEPEEES